MSGERKEDPQYLAILPQFGMTPDQVPNELRA